MEVERAAGGDLLMECDEEEQEVWPRTQETVKEKDEGKRSRDRSMANQHWLLRGRKDSISKWFGSLPLQSSDGISGVRTVVRPMEQQSKDPPPVRIIPITFQPVNSCSPTTLNHTEMPSDGPLDLTMNGQLVPRLPEGSGAELKQYSQPKGSAIGFTSVEIPITVTVISPAGSRHINTTISLFSTSNTRTAPKPAAAPPEPKAGSTPIITGVVSGEAAQKVLNNHNVNFKSSSPLTNLKTPPILSLTSTQTTQPASKKKKPPPSCSGPAAPLKLRHKGQLGPKSPPACTVCLSQYRFIPELRGFMCLCSPEIAQSLLLWRNLKRKNKSRMWSREKKTTSRVSRDSQSSSKVSRTGSGLPARTRRSSDDFLSDQFTSTAHPSDLSSRQQDLSEATHAPLQGKLVILVEDFYYGSARGTNSTKPDQHSRTLTGPYRCIHCPMTLCNNLELMSHMQQHVMSQEDRNSMSLCPHCFRHFPSPFKLQCHQEAVHSQSDSTVTCRICELEFGSEPVFLRHMKNTHKPGEMPYVCQVCDFRSSFYSDVWSHFQEAHADTKHLLCQYCLRVLRSHTCYQQHFAQHQKKHMFSCDKCRLNFLYIKERMEHKLLHHKTHVRPSQLTGLKPGTKVTVRTYSVVEGAESEEAIKKAVVPCKVVNVEPPPPQDVPKRKPVESLGPLLSNLSKAAGVSWPLQHCVECLSIVHDFNSHFPSMVHCFLCRFLTCCSTSYANHMINKHSTSRRNPKYKSLFQSGPRLSHRLECASCSLCSYRGDVMANHLIERPDHDCKVHTDQNADRAQQTHNCPPSPHSVTSPGVQRHGAFIPIHLLPVSKTSTQLAVKPLPSPSPLSSPPAMTITFLGPCPQPEQPPAAPLSISQLAAVLSSLCHGVSQASRRCKTSALLICSWTRQLERGLWGRKWCWKTEKLAESLLLWREQQLVVSEDILLQRARGILGEDSPLIDCYNWTVDFMLRYDAGRQTSSQTVLPRKIKKKIHTFIQSLRSQIHSKALPLHSVGCMDEFSIFVDSDSFNDQNQLAFQLFGSPGDSPLFDIVLSALSDGTILTPLVFFRGTTSRVPEGFPDNVLLEARQEGFTDQERLHIWVNKVWRPHLAALGCDSESVLMVDVHRGHLSNQFRDDLSSISTDSIVIPSGCCCRLQPLDVCVTPVLRDFLQVRWTQLVSQGGLDGLGLDQLALTLSCWLSEVCTTLNSETNVLLRSFSSVCDLQQVEDRCEAARMIKVLNEALIQPLETPGPGPGPGLGPELELLLVMEEEKQEEKMESREEVEN